MLLRTKSTKTLTIRGENGKWTGPPAPPYIWPCSYLPKMWYMLTMLLLSNAVTTKLCIAKEPVNRLAVALEFLTISESIVRFSWAGTLARPYFWNNSERNARSPLAIRPLLCAPASMQHKCRKNATIPWANKANKLCVLYYISPGICVVFVQFAHVQLFAGHSLQALC